MAFFSILLDICGYTLLAGLLLAGIYEALALLLPHPVAPPTITSIVRPWFKTHPFLAGLLVFVVVLAMLWFALHFFTPYNYL